MRRLSFPLCLFTLLAACPRLPAQIAGPVDTVQTTYTAKGMTDQPFSVEIINARRTVSNSLLVRLTLTNLGTAPIRPVHDFSGNANPADADTIASLYAVDPNGQAKYPVLRTADGRPLCSKVAPELKPGEHRTLYAQLLAPPDTSSSLTINFPKADPILHVPIGLPQAGEPIPPEAGAGEPLGVPAPAAALPVAPSSAIDQPGSNNQPNVYTNQTQLIPSGTAFKAIGSVTSANSTVPFTVEVLDLKSTPSGATLRVAMTNNGSGNLDATGQFIGGFGSPGDPHDLRGVYLADPVSQRQFKVSQDPQAGGAKTSKVDPPLGPGERRVLEAQFPMVPAGIKSVYVYFPRAAAISNVPVSR